MKPADVKQFRLIQQATQVRITLNQHESFINVVLNDDSAMIGIETFQVKELVREDRFEKKGMKIIFLKRGPNGWYLDTEKVIWDDSFVPFVFEKKGRRKTLEEFTEQREWEKMCHRPGSARTPLDSYDRVLSGETTPKMERYW